MQTAIVRHILVKDKDLAEQLKRSYKVVLTLPNLPNNTPPVIRQNVVVNLVKSKGQLVPVIDKVVLRLLNVYYKVNQKPVWLSSLRS